MADQPTSLADTALSILSKLSGDVELNLAFNQVELQVPNQQNPAAPAATWKLNGSLSIRTKGSPAAPSATAPAVRVAPPAPSGYPQPTAEQSAPRG